jgi:glycosyltransferase involved in cell wall biosynthesis
MRVKNEARWIRRSIESIRPLCETVVVFDDNSTDETADICRSMDGVLLVRSPYTTLDEIRDKNDLLLKVSQFVPDWVVMIDGDEILANGEYLRDRLQAVVWNDEYLDGGDPTVHLPMWVLEADGSMALTNSRLVRIDLLRSIDISISVVTNHLGIEEAWGNTNPDARVFVEMWMRAAESGRMSAWPPFSCEPHIVHRSNLRHPLRRGLRLHEQEAAELRRAGKL